ncbi:MAG: GDSL-type esterase/lipase family protein [Coleofasciculus sp. G1-WW12-02]|uniref:GDSL-type esterase/lipase family protein n=1 Tax=Coleofasciculus sp. G1-WW12-02 TaxID=3068483 RepID=UPI0032F1D5D9
MTIKRVCFVGDSFVNGTGDPEYLGWTGRICAAIRKQGYDLTYYNLGIRRETSADISTRWLPEASRRLPEGCDGGIVFSFGVNDTTIEQGKGRIPFKDSVKNANQILTVAKGLFPVLMVSPPPIADRGQNMRTAELSQQFAEVCHQLSIPYLDVFSSLQASKVWMDEVAAYDGAHPSASGYSQMAELVQRWKAWQAWFR